MFGCRGFQWRWLVRGEPGQEVVVVVVGCGDKAVRQRRLVQQKYLLIKFSSCSSFKNIRMKDES